MERTATRRSSPPVFTSPLLARSTRDSCTCSMLFGSNPGEIQSALPCFVGIPFASGEAIRRLRSRACHDPHDPHSPRSPSRRLITLFSCIRPDVPIRTLECPIGCLYPSTSAAPSGMKTAPKCAPGKRKEQQQQITESERNVIASDIRPRQGHHSPPTGRDHIHCDSVCHHRFYV